VHTINGSLSEKLRTPKHPFLTQEILHFHWGIFDGFAKAQHQESALDSTEVCATLSICPEMVIFLHEFYLNGFLTFFPVSIPTIYTHSYYYYSLPVCGADASEKFSKIFCVSKLGSRKKSNGATKIVV